MTTALAFLNGTILAAIAVLHLFWMAGGRWGLDQALPTNEQGKRTMQPGPLACGVVAAGLFCFAVYYYSIAWNVSLGLPFGAEKWGIWVLAGTFALRAVGDFRYVGFFKKLKTTEFARMDTRCYAPLCAWLGLTSVYLAID